MADQSVPVKYVLFSHYGKNDDQDFRDFRTIDIGNLEGITWLASHFRGLRELLNAPGHQGILVLFYAPGYARFLDKLAHPNGPQQLEEDQKLEFARKVKEHVVARLKEERLDDRVRFLIPQDLEVILHQTNEFHRDLFHSFFLGPAAGLRYDSPKVVEAILRLRILGNGVPVFRLDHDVLFRGNTTMGDLGLFKAVACALRAYQLRMADPTVSTFLFSASYNSKTLISHLNSPTHNGQGAKSDGSQRDSFAKTDKPDAFEAWGRAFATRIYPALIAKPSEINKIFNSGKETQPNSQEQAKAWDNYALNSVHEDLARQFYGLSDDRTKLETVETNGLVSIGAHPTYAVISGALLCLSDGAILDLPPYSNLRMNVMWIDDHLKYSLHRAMNHFTSGDTLDLEAGLSDARLDDVHVTKARPPVGSPPLPIYIFDIYLPTLLWGAVFDAWITNDAILKLRVKDKALNKEAEKRRWREAKKLQHKAALPAAMTDALRKGSFNLDGENRLTQKLEDIAIARIEEVRKLWAKMKDGETKTFACYWAEGTVADHFNARDFGDRELWKGIAPGRSLDLAVTDIRHLDPGLRDRLKDLIHDAVAYVKWTLEWPKVVQIVRSIQQGTFVGDLGWEPGSEGTDVDQR